MEWAVLVLDGSREVLHFAGFVEGAHAAARRGEAEKVFQRVTLIENVRQDLTGEMLEENGACHGRVDVGLGPIWWWVLQFSV